MAWGRASGWVYFQGSGICSAINSNKSPVTPSSWVPYFWWSWSEAWPYIIVKYSQRRRFLRHLRIARITPEELKSKLDAGEDLMILDVRHSVEFKADPQTIPGALFWPLEQLEKGQPPIPPDREVILYCN
jgi:hypothetical protein